MVKLKPIVKIHGGKYYLSQWVIDNFPKDYHILNYLEPFCGGCNIILNKPTSITETVSDIDLGIISILNNVKFNLDNFINKLNLIEYNREVFITSKEIIENKLWKDELDYGVNEFILRRMSRGGLKKDFSWAIRLRGGQNESVNAWQGAPKTTA